MLVTGPTGSGKSTSLASMIDLINEERAEHILTIEDPIEFLHKHKKCIVNQREIGSDAIDFAGALKSALREDPDVILVGEMRDLETISTALTAAETGHLVFATLHTQSTAQTVDRIIDVFPPHQQQQVRMQLSIALQGIVTQQLVPTADGSGRVCATEVLVPTPAVRNLIREGKTHQIYSAIQTSGSVGMQTMDSHLAAACPDGQDRAAAGAAALVGTGGAQAPARPHVGERGRQLGYGRPDGLASRRRDVGSGRLRVQSGRPCGRAVPGRRRGQLQDRGHRAAPPARADRPGRIRAP